MQADIDQARPGRIRINHAYYESDALKQVPGLRWHARGEDYWSLPLQLPALYALVETFGDRLDIADDLDEWIRETFKAVVLPIRKLKKSPLALPEGFTEYTDILDMYRGELAEHGLALRKFQEVAAVMLPIAKHICLADGLGAGKTIEVIAALVLADDPFPALIVVPPSVLGNWANEFASWAPDFRVHVLEGTPAKRRKAIQNFIDDDGHVLLTTYENMKGHSRAASYGNQALKRCEACGGSPDVIEADGKLRRAVTPSRCEAHAKELNGIDWNTVVIDEAHRIADPTTTQTRTAWGVSRGAEYRWALTATPTEEHPGQFWSILHFLNPDEWPTSVGYRDRYCEQFDNYWGGVEIKRLRPDRVAEFHKATEHRILRRPKALILPELPPKVYSTRLVELSAKERKSYDEMKQKLITQLDSGTLYASSPLVLAGRLFQMSAGLIDAKRLGPDDVEVTFTGESSVLDEVDSLAEEMGDSTPFGVYFVNVGLLEHCWRRLAKAGHRVCGIYGAVSTADRTKAVEDFQKGRTNVFLGTYGAASEGITLTRASEMIRPQLPWSSLQYSQSEDRFHRIGSEIHFSINYLDIYAKNTIAAKVPGLFKHKVANLQEILRDEEILRSVLE